MKKFLLGDNICSHCGGFGVLKEKFSSFRIRIHFPNDGDWHFLDDNYMSLDDAMWSAIDMRHGDEGILFEIVTPNGEIVAV